jgi:hypothetical protein
MSDAALVPVYPTFREDPFAARLLRGFRRIELGFRLIGRGLGDVAVAIFGPFVSFWAALLVGVWRALVAVVRAVVHVFVVLAATVVALLRQPGRVLALWARWAWQATRPILYALVLVLALIGRFAAAVTVGSLIALGLVALTPVLGAVFEGARLLAGQLGEGFAALADRLPSAEELARLPWDQWGAVGARIFWAAFAILLIGAAVTLLAFGLWLLALSAYVAGRSVLAATPPIVYGARRAGVTTLQAIGFVAYLLARTAAENLLLILVLTLFAIALGLTLAYGAELRAALPDLDLGARVADGLAAVSFGGMIALALAAAVLALVMLARVLASAGGRQRRAVLPFLALAIPFSLMLLLAQPGVSATVGAFVDECLALLRRGSQVAVAEAASAPAPADEARVAPEPEAAPSQTPVATTEVVPSPEPSSPPADAPSTNERLVEVALVYPKPEAGATWALGSDALLATAAAQGVEPARIAGLEPETVCAAGALIAVGAASSDGARTHNETLAYRRGVVLGRLAVDAAAACDPATRPAVWVLSLGQSTLTPASPEQRAPAVLALGAEPPRDDAGRLDLALPFDRASYSAEALCLLSARDDQGAPACADR